MINKRIDGKFYSELERKLNTVVQRDRGNNTVEIHFRNSILLGIRSLFKLNRGAFYLSFFSHYDAGRQVM